MSSAAEQHVVIVLTTLGVKHDAGAMARTLVDEQLAACVNILPPMRSVYRWQGTIADEGERQLLIKTLPARLEALTQRLLALHPYETPEFLVLDATGSEAYLAWLGDSIS